MADALTFPGDNAAFTNLRLYRGGYAYGSRHPDGANVAMADGSVRPSLTN